MASIKKKSDDTYLITVSKGRDINNKQLFERITYHPAATTPKKREKEVEDFARDFERQVRSGELYAGDKTTFAEYYKIWDENWAKDHLTQRELENYRSIIERIFLPYFGKKALSDIKANEIEAIYRKAKTQGRTIGTIKKYHTALNSVMKHAFMKEEIKKNPCDLVELPREFKGNDEIHCFNLDQAKRFLSSLDQEFVTEYQSHSRVSSTGKEFSVQAYKERHTVATQWKAYFTLAIYGGFRRGEMLALTWEDIDFDKMTVTINKAMSKTKANGQIIKETKSKAGNRTIRLPSTCFDILKKWHKEEKERCLALGSKWAGFRGSEFDKNYVFIQLSSGRMMDGDAPYNRMKSVIRAYNDQCVKEGRDNDQLPDIRLHDLRHTAATLLLGMTDTDIETVSHRMGHSKASVTLNIYGHWLEETDAKAADAMGQLLG